MRIILCIFLLSTVLNKFAVASEECPSGSFLKLTLSDNLLISGEYLPVINIAYLGFLNYLNTTNDFDEMTDEWKKMSKNIKSYTMMLSDDEKILNISFGWKLVLGQFPSVGGVSYSFDKETLDLINVETYM